MRASGTQIANTPAILDHLHASSSPHASIAAAAIQLHPGNSAAQAAWSPPIDAG